MSDDPVVPDLLSPAEFVIGKFGGLTSAAKSIGKPVTTVQGWKERGQIPQKWWADLMSAAAARGQSISYEDFVKRHPASEAIEAQP